MKHIILFLFFIMACIGINAESRTKVLIKTTRGDITVELYNETPKHRDNFIHLCKEHFYDSLLFHRVIRSFMIQTGDPESKGADIYKHLGNGGPGYTIPAEIQFPKLYHKRGALAAARQGDMVNPERESSGSQFYIVWGKKYTENELDNMEEVLSKREGIIFPKEVRKTYRTIGGTPHLDGSYSVFGEVVDGLNVVEDIQNSSVNMEDRPRTDVLILETQIIQ